MASEMILYASPRLPELQEVKEILAETFYTEKRSVPSIIINRAFRTKIGDL